MHRWHQHPRDAGRRRGWEKSLRRHRDEPADHGLGRSRGGFGSKLHVVVDGRGTPLVAEITAGQAHESKHVESLMDGIAIPQPLGRPRKRPKRLAGDKAYSVRRIRDWLRAHGITPVIPHKDNEAARYDARVKFDKASYRRRAVVEQCIGWLKEFRRIGTRFEKLAVNFLGMVHLAMIRRYLKLLFSDGA